MTYPLFFHGAEGETRTPTGEPPLDPEPSVSANSTTSALLITTEFTEKIFYFKRLAGILLPSPLCPLNCLFFFSSSLVFCSDTSYLSATPSMLKPGYDAVNFYIIILPFIVLLRTQRKPLRPLWFKHTLFFIKLLTIPDAVMCQRRGSKVVAI